MEKREGTKEIEIEIAVERDREGWRWEEVQGWGRERDSKFSKAEGQKNLIISSQLTVYEA